MSYHLIPFVTWPQHLSALGSHFSSNTKHLCVSRAFKHQCKDNFKIEPPPLTHDMIQIVIACNINVLSFG
ncbi:hypothetical protein NC652_026387 [Populus alba x Populus x berolinensis]|uniref:Uncharacterized protein n=1 Tax=Populus alba x Populus x berolinensis TaxID=444605 RepID=A0AAD6Q8C7_9ROSI|nr:hypothetical protein NC652_026387 [Populus alba x Populus x berolinensis]KAJ6983004.1 hypothetical protein NC653_025966 [Populus alba x Populus x berolinensis]